MVEDYSYKRNEDIIYIGQYPQDKLFDVHFAGVSYPDPQYKKRRDTASDVLIIEYVIRGCGYICADNKTCPVEAGDMYLINANFPHSYFSDKSDPFEKIWINVSGSLPMMLLKAYLPERGCYIAKGCEEAYRLLSSAHSILRDSSLTGSQAIARVSLIVHELLILLRDSVGSQQQSHKLSREEAIRECLDRSITSEISLDKLAARYYISKNQMIRSFRAEFGITPMKYLMKKRLEAAERLIESTSMSVSQIAALLKFSSPQHLSAAFKRFMGHNLSKHGEKEDKTNAKPEN